jgi:hypothetical protein
MFTPMNQLKAIIQTGIKTHTPLQLAEKITLANIFALLVVAIVGLPFSIITCIEAQPLTFFLFALLLLH